MLTLSPKLTMQLEMDFETDKSRLARHDWQVAVERNLHALRDYVNPNQAIVWQPGLRKRGPDTGGYGTFNVQLTTVNDCTCSTFKLKGRCEHVAFVKRLESGSIELGQDVPVRAVEIEGIEEAA